ncbi:MAG: beta-L-arabinofuranosidase domain-containing protein [Flavitalea sp.]
MNNTTLATSVLSAIVILTFNVSVAQVKHTSVQASTVASPNNATRSANYVTNKAPLQAAYFEKLPVTAIKPGGWLRKQIELQKEGLTGNLGEISIWLSRDNNAWLNKEGKGEYGWEELPYWLKGYGNIAYMLNDQKMIAETKFWIEAVLSNQRANGDFGPMVEKGKGKRDLWTNMPMLWCLQSYYEYSKDARVLSFMTKYFKWQNTIPDSLFLEDFWEKSRGGDNMVSVYWLYNYTGEKFLLDLATKIDRNTADWRQKTDVPNWHNVNIAQCFREPATYYLQSHKTADLDATYNNHKIVRDQYGQMPGGMFGADENARKGFDDPRQAIETCALVEQITSNQMLLRWTGDVSWADHTEDVAFNTFPAAFMPDYRSLRYLTAPNMVLNDDKNHHPGIDNSGPFLMMNPFSSRCCQHNHAAGWVYYTENSWMATPDNGLAVQLYAQDTVTAKVAKGQTVTIVQDTKYPFENMVNFTVRSKSAVAFPLYLRIPSWCKDPKIMVNGEPVKFAVQQNTGTNIVNGTNQSGYFVKLTSAWQNGDKISLQLPMELSMREWSKNKNSVSLNYGPLTYSLKIGEEFVKKDSRKTAMGDSKWQATADPEKWPAFEIHPTTAWNYGLVYKPADLLSSFQVVQGSWPSDNNPWTPANAPLSIQTKGKKIPGWTIDQYGLCGILPQSPVKTSEAIEELTLIPMGCARLRIASFPVAE